MRGHWIRVLVLALAAAGCSGGSSFNQPTLSADETAAVEKALRTIESWGRDPVIVREVAAQNEVRMTPAQLDVINRAWVSGGERERATTLMKNPCSTRLNELAAASRAFRDPAALDRRGASVCISTRSREFWRGADTPPPATLLQPRYIATTKSTHVRVVVAVKNGSTPIGSITVDVDPALLPQEHLARAEQTGLPEARD